jgi:hypothetical protein
MLLLSDAEMGKGSNLGQGWANHRWCIELIASAGNQAIEDGLVVELVLGDHPARASFLHRFRKSTA